MKALILYRPLSEHARLVEEFIHDYKARYPQIKLEVRSTETREGADMARIYDITQYPAIVVAQNDGTPQKTWQGEGLPLIDEVASYARA